MLENITFIGPFPGQGEPAPYIALEFLDDKINIKWGGIDDKEHLKRIVKSPFPNEPTVRDGRAWSLGNMVLDWIDKKNLDNYFK